ESRLLPVRTAQIGGSARALEKRAARQRHIARLRSCRAESRTSKPQSASQHHGCFRTRLAIGCLPPNGGSKATVITRKGWLNILLRCFVFAKQECFQSREVDDIADRRLNVGEQ